jgi:hypothetical protein
MFDGRRIRLQYKQYPKKCIKITTVAHNVCDQALVFLVCIVVVPLQKFSVQLYYKMLTADDLLTAAKKSARCTHILCTPALKKSTAVGTLCTYPCVPIVLHMCRGLLAPWEQASGRHVCVYSACVDLSVWTETDRQTGQYPAGARGQVRKTWPTEYGATWRKDNLNN